MAEVHGDGRYVLFSGCAAARPMPPLPFAPSGQPARRATIALARELHLDLWEAPHAGCCGARADLRVSEEARGKALAPLLDGVQRGLDVACLSPACRRVVGGYLPATAPGPHASTHVHDVVGLLTFGYDLSRLAAATTNPLTGLRVALHSTCHADHNVTVTPPMASPAQASQRRGGLGGLLGRAPWSRAGQAVESVTRGHEPANATDVAALGRIVTAIGADAAGDVSPRGRCAWNNLLAGAVSRFLGETGSAPCLRLAARSGVDVLVTPCFLCFIGLNTYQRAMPRSDPARSVPVFHISQLVGLACGVAPQPFSLANTTVSARRALLPFIA